MQTIIKALKTPFILVLCTMGFLFGQNTESIGGNINSLTGSENPRRDLRELSNTVMDPADNESLREGHEEGLLSLLEGSSDAGVRGIFFRELTLTGTVPGTATGIGSYLSNEDLVIEASRALIGIGTYEGGETRLEACRVIGIDLATATGGGLTALQKAAGSLACTDAGIVATLITQTDNLMAIRALALIGDASSQAQVTSALNNPDHGEKSKTIVWALDYVVQLSMRGQKDVANEVIAAIEVAAAQGDFAHMQDYIAEVKASIPGIEVHTRHTLKTEPLTYFTARVGVNRSIEVKVSYSGSYDLELRDVSGKILAKRTGNQKSSLTFTANSLAGGLYILIMNVESGSYRQMVAVQ